MALGRPVGLGRGVALGRGRKSLGLWGDADHARFGTQLHGFRYLLYVARREEPVEDIFGDGARSFELIEMLVARPLRVLP